MLSLRVLLFMVLVGPSCLAYSQNDAPASFRIQNLRSDGSGCPLGTVAVNVASDQQAFTLSFSEFVAEVSPAVAKTEERKNCRLVFDTEQDAGWEYSILAISFRGYAALESGVHGRQNLRVGGQGKENQTALNLDGPYDDDYINTQQIGLGNLKWSGCQANKIRDFAVDVNLWLKADNAESRGLLTVDSIDGEVRQEYELVWRSCTDKSKRFLSTCSLEASNPRKGTVRSLFTKGQARSEALALQKAKNKMGRICDRLTARGLSCDANRAACQSM